MTQYEETFISILKEELRPAMGCTEPIAIAYAGALVRKTLGEMPERIDLIVSGNIIKNVKSVIVPHTGKRKGLKAAVAIGVLAGREDLELEVISGVTEEEISQLGEFMDHLIVQIKEAESDFPFDILIRAYRGDNEAMVRLIGHHTNVVRIEKNGNILMDEPVSEDILQTKESKKELSIERIVEFADTVEVSKVKDVLQRQIDYNMAIARAGMEGHYGAEIGRTLMLSYGDTVQNRAKAYAAAGSDARMNGCELPVVINSGSGNQGMTASIPVIVYARDMGVSEEKLLRALIISNLVTIHLKTGIGSLSAYCGATSAGVGAGAGICYLHGGKFREIAHTIVNALAINSGMICDGAKASCAAKIASALEAGFLGWQMNVYHQQFRGGDGIVVKGVENTIRAVGKLARDGMKETDREIIHLMIDE